MVRVVAPCGAGICQGWLSPKRSEILVSGDDVSRCAIGRTLWGASKEPPSAKRS